MHKAYSTNTYIYIYTILYACVYTCLSSYFSVIDLYHGLCVCFLRYDLISGDPYTVLLGWGGIPFGTQQAANDDGVGAVVDHDFVVCHIIETLFLLNMRRNIKRNGTI